MGKYRANIFPEPKGEHVRTVRLLPVILLCFAAITGCNVEQNSVAPESLPFAINGWETEGANAAQLEAMSDEKFADWMPSELPQETIIEAFFARVIAGQAIGKPVEWINDYDGGDWNFKFESGDDDQPSKITVTNQVNKTSYVMIKGDDDCPNLTCWKRSEPPSLGDDDDPLHTKPSPPEPLSLGDPPATQCVGMPRCKDAGRGVSKCIDACGQTFYHVQVDVSEYVCVSMGGGCVYDCNGFAASC